MPEKEFAQTPNICAGFSLFGPASAHSPHNEEAAEI
jgi:hypothetical protein